MSGFVNFGPEPVILHGSEPVVGRVELWITCKLCGKVWQLTMLRQICPSCKSKP